MNIKKAQDLMRKIYDTYATYGIYAVEGQRTDTYHDHMHQSLQEDSHPPCDHPLTRITHKRR